MKRSPLIIIFFIAFSFTAFNFRSTSVTVIPYTGATVVNACTGETVSFSGSMMLVQTNLWNGNNGLKKIIAKPVDLSFVSNGETFRALGVSIPVSYHLSANNSKAVISGVNNMVFIGDKGSRYVMHESGHYVWNANGDLTSFVYNRNLFCSE